MNMRFVLTPIVAIAAIVGSVPSAANAAGVTFESYTTHGKYDYYYPSVCSWTWSNGWDVTCPPGQTFQYFTVRYTMTGSHTSFTFAPVAALGPSYGNPVTVTPLSDNASAVFPADGKSHHLNATVSEFGGFWPYNGTDITHSSLSIFPGQN